MNSRAENQAEKPPTLVLIVGPIAAGKSTVARALAQQLRLSGGKVAVVELDQIAEMALPTLPDWAFAHFIFGSVVGQWLRSPLDIVIAEGPGNRSEVDGVLAQIPPAATIVTVVPTSSLEVAFSRAQEDPTRGISRSHQFLSDEFQRWAHDMTYIEHDLVIDTGFSSVNHSIARVRSQLQRIRR